MIILADATLAAALFLIHVHGPQGQNIDININEISSIRQPRENAEQHFGKGTNCLVYMTDGHFIATTETCLEIGKLISAKENDQ